MIGVQRVEHFFFLGVEYYDELPVISRPYNSYGSGTRSVGIDGASEISRYKSKDARSSGRSQNHHPIAALDLDDPARTWA